MMTDKDKKNYEYAIEEFKSIKDLLDGMPKTLAIFAIQKKINNIIHLQVHSMKIVLIEKGLVTEEELNKAYIKAKEQNEEHNKFMDNLIKGV